MLQDYALIIGINDYTPLKKKGLKRLDNAIRDAQDFEQWFRHESGPQKKVCETVYSTSTPLSPLYHEIEEKLQRLIDIAEEDPDVNHRLYFYFAGHGMGLHYDPNDNALCLATWSERAPNEALSSREYHKIFIQFGYFKQVIILLDCCREINGRVMPRTSKFNPPPRSGPYQADVFVGYATRYGNLAFEIDNGAGEKRGAFTSVLLRGLRGGAANADGVVDSDSLKRYLDKNIPEEANKHKYDQRPDVLNGLVEPDTILGVIGSLQTVCVLDISSHRTGHIVLVNGSGEIVHKMHDVAGKVIKIPLEYGTYLLVDKKNHESVPIEMYPSAARGGQVVSVTTF